ncbi:MAG: CinA family protein [Actinobacteria bacterium]|nr:CinA family protein [Actinomycetota bacterium]
MSAVDAASLIARLVERGDTVATAESLTGGLVCAALTAVPGASAVVRGGIISYAVSVKADVLGVDAGLLARRGAVDPAVAAQMAIEARRLLGSDYAVATTGSAGPDPAPGGSHSGPVAPGRGFVAVAGPEGEVVSGFACEGEDRDGVRRHAVQAALNLLGRVLAGTD